MKFRESLKMYYEINFLNEEGNIVLTFKDYFINEESLGCFLELMLILHNDIADYVLI